MLDKGKVSVESCEDVSHAGYTACEITDSF
jgi:hypothetical protein